MPSSEAMASADLPFLALAMIDFFSFATSAVLRRAALRAGFFAAGFLGFTDLTTIAFFVFRLLVATLAVTFFFAFLAMQYHFLSQDELS